MTPRLKQALRDVGEALQLAKEDRAQRALQKMRRALAEVRAGPTHREVLRHEGTRSYVERVPIDQPEARGSSDTPTPIETTLRRSKNWEWAIAFTIALWTAVFIIWLTQYCAR